MAIVKMKKLRAVALASQRDALLQELQLLGCVELTSQERELEDSAAALARVDSGPLVETQAERQLFRKAIGVLDQYAPVKTPLLKPKPEITAAALLDETGAEAMENAARELDGYSERLKALAAEEVKENLRVAALSPWKSCELPLDHPGTKNARATFGILPMLADYGALCAALEREVGAAELFEVGRDDAARYLYAVHLKSDTEAVLKVLREYGFTAPAYGDVHGTAAANIAEAEQHLAQIAAERQSVEKKIAGAAQYREGLQHAYDRAETKVGRAEAAGKLLKTESAVLLEGWADATRETEVTALLERLGCAYEFEDPSEEEYGDVPVQLRNNKLTDGLNMVTNMYSLPRYGTLDPNPLMAPFFIVFYGIMMADMGYGLLMMLIGLVIMTQKKPRKGFMRYFGELLIEGGITTFIFGVLTAGFFGDAPKQIALMINPESTFTWFWPALFDPLNDTIYVLIGAMILGFIQLVTGLAVNFVQKMKHGDTLDAVLYEGAFFVMFLGAALWVLTGMPPVVLILGALMLFAGAARGKKGVGIITSIFSTLYNEVTGWFGDILSYSRLMALMLAGSVIAQVFNTLGALPRNIIVFIVIFLVGHALNFGLNLLGCYVHDLRLQCLEYFGKFYTDGGRPFAPLSMGCTKYVDVVEK